LKRKISSLKHENVCDSSAIIGVVFVLMLLAGAYEIFTGGLALRNLSSKDIKAWSKFRLSSSLKNLSSERFQFTVQNKGCQVARISSLAGIGQAFVSDRFEFDQECLGIEKSFIQFPVEGFGDGGKTWTTVPSSGYRWVRKGIRFMQRNGPSPPCHPSIQVDTNPPWPSLVEFGVGSILAGCGCIGVAFLLAADKDEHASIIIATSLFAANSIVAAAGYASFGLERQAVSPAGKGLLSFAIAVLLARKRPRLAMMCSILSIAGCAAAALRVIIDCFLFHDCAYLAEHPPLIEAASAVLGAGVLLRARAVAARRRQLDQSDAAAWDAEWQRLQASGESTWSLAVLQNISDDLAIACPPGPPRHCLPIVPGSHGLSQAGEQQRKLRRMDTWDAAAISRALLSSTRSSRLSSYCDNLPETEPAPAAPQGLPAESLDQLYTQALAVAPQLRDLCVRLAAAAGGKVDNLQDAGKADSFGRSNGTAWAIDSDGADSESEDLLPEALRALVRARWVKPPARAAEKSAWLHGRDASRLTDLCRGRLVFGSPGGVADCLRAVTAAAPEVAVVRVSNGLRPGHDAGPNGGFRVRRR
jgi:hypothetical protein